MKEAVRLAVVGAALVLLAACPPSAKKVVVKAPSAEAPAPAGPLIEVEVVSQPEKALVIFNEKEVGETPLRLQFRDLGEITRLTARREGQNYVEKRIRILAPDRLQVVFSFGEVSAVLKALGLARAVVFDYSDRAAFDVNKAELKPEILPILDRQAQLLILHFGTIPIYVCGHTDSTGTAAYNLELSLERAKVVAAYLETRQVPRERMRIQGFGPDYPLDSNDTPAGRALNRRTELVLTE